MKRVVLALGVLAFGVLLLAGSMGAPAMFTAQRQDRLRDGSCDGIPDQIRDRDRDGSGEEAVA